jgi:ubiquitin C-terminal hydrolase
MIYHVGFLSLFYFKEIIDSIVQYYKFDGYEDIQVYINYFLLDLNENYYKKKVAANKR